MASPQDVDLVCPGVGQVDVVRGYHHGCPGMMQLLGELHELQGHLRIEPRRGLVHHQHLRVHGQGARQGEPLPLPVGQLHGVPVPKVVQADEAQGPVHPRGNLRCGQPQVGRTVGHVLLHRLPEDLVVGVLQDDAHPGPEGPERPPPVGKRLAVEEYPPACGLEHPVEMVEQRGLPGAVGSQDHGLHALPYPDADLAQGVAVVASVAVPEVHSLYDVLGSHGTTSGARPNLARSATLRLTTSTSSGSQ